MKNTNRKISVKEIAGIIGVAIFFIGVTFITQKYGSLLREMPYFEGLKGIFLYLFITVIAVVVAPVSTLPLLPLAVALWGSLWAAVLSIVGWVTGAAIAFALARYYGKPFVEKVMPLEKIQRTEKIIPKHYIFISIVLLRMALPVDILSYVLGLFSSVSFRLYLTATVIGVSPFAFFFAYAAGFPPGLQFIAILLTILVLTISYRKWK